MTPTDARQRSYDRAHDGLRPTTIQRDFAKPATGARNGAALVRTDLQPVPYEPPSAVAGPPHSADKE